MLIYEFYVNLLLQIKFDRYRKIFGIEKYFPKLFRYALGSAKVNELSFLTVEEIVAFYMKEELMLHSGGVQTGSTRLTDTPPK